MRSLILIALAACGPAAPSATPSPAPISSPAPIASPDPSAPKATAEQAVDEAVPERPTTERGTWKQELAEPASSVGVGKRRVAVLTTKNGEVASAWMRDGGKWSDLKLPGKMLAEEGERDALRIWFGRDDRPRVMGTRYRADGSGEMVYLRWKGNWRDKAGEIGRLDADPQAPLFGILGHDDPEVVCKLGDTCIIKRLTGWTMIPPPPEVLRVELAGKYAVGVGKTVALSLGKESFEPISKDVPWSTAPAGLWADAGGGVWVAEPERDRLHHWDGTTWSTAPSPQRGPRALWGSAPNDVFLAAEGGVAHWDGKAWSRLRSPEGAFVDVRGGYEGEVWIVGPAGVWRGETGR